MFELGFVKPLLTSLALPPAAPLLLALLGLLLAWRTQRAGLALAALALAGLWLLACHGTAVWLARHALPQFQTTTAAKLKTGRVQAVSAHPAGIYSYYFHSRQPAGFVQAAAGRRARLAAAIQTLLRGLRLHHHDGQGRRASQSTTLPGRQIDFAVPRYSTGMGALAGQGRFNLTNQTRSRMTAMPCPTPMHIVHSA